MPLNKQTTACCGAKTRLGNRCQHAAMANGRCRLHGGTSTGAPKGNKNAWKHGRYSQETMTTRKLVRAAARLVRSITYLG